MGPTSRIVAASLAALVMLVDMGLLASRTPPPADVVASRVVATPIPTPTPTPPPPEPEPARSAAPHCPELEGPGGGVVVHAADPGPSPTDGAVAIPAIGVRAPLVRVGVTPAGEMVVPRTASDVAWLDGGSFPGTTNNAVLAGHHDWNRRLGSFYRLGDLREGDEVTVSLDGRSWTFRVAWVCSFDLDTPEAHRIMGPTDVPSVTLVTCGGVFDRRRRTHAQRVVVRAELVEATQAA